jgi:nitrogen regulatory protein P-II 1
MGKVKTDAVSVGRGTMRYKPEFIPRTEVEVIVKDEKVEGLISVFRDKLVDNIGGKLFVINVEKAMDLSTGNSDEGVYPSKLGSLSRDSLLLPI